MFILLVVLLLVGGVLGVGELSKVKRDDLVKRFEKDGFKVSDKVKGDVVVLSDHYVLSVERDNRSFLVFGKV